MLTEKLWFSDHTKFKKCIIRDWNEKGLRFIADLFCKDSGAPLDRRALCEKFNIKMTFLCHSSMLRSITPLNISSNDIMNIKHPILPYKIALLSTKTNMSRVAYEELVIAMNKHNNSTSTQNSVERKWCRDIDCMHEGTMKDIRLATRNTYLQSFHYRIVNRIISTNTFLFKLGKSESPLLHFLQLC